MRFTFTPSLDGLGSISDGDVRSPTADVLSVNYPRAGVAEVTYLFEEEEAEMTFVLDAGEWVCELNDPE